MANRNLRIWQLTVTLKIDPMDIVATAAAVGQVAAAVASIPAIAVAYWTYRVSRSALEVSNSLKVIEGDAASS